VFGSLGDLFALGFAAQTLVASLGGGSTIVANVVFARFWLKQDLYLTDILGVIFVSIGVVVLALSSSEEGKYTMNELFTLMQAPGFIMYAILTTGFVMVLILRVRRSSAPALRAVPISPAEKTAGVPIGTTNQNVTETQPATNVVDSSPFPSPIYDTISLTPTSNKNEMSSAKEFLSEKSSKLESQKHTLIIDKNLPLYWAAISGTIGAQSVLLAKCVMEMIFVSMEGENQFKFFGTYILVGGMVACLLTQTHALNMATMCGDTMSTFPVFQAFWIGMSNISGIVFFQEAHKFTQAQWMMFPSALILVMVGIYLVAKHEKMGNTVKYSVAMPVQLSSPRQHDIVAQSFVFKELTPQHQDDPYVEDIRFDSPIVVVA